MENIQRPRILIVEDDFENQKFLELFMKRKFEVNTCDSAETFYRQLKEHNFDIFLMDISLKGNKDGLQLTTEIRDTEEYKNVPIVGLSAHAFQRDKDNAKRAGVDTFLTKPIQNNVLMEKVLSTFKDKTGIDLS